METNDTRTYKPFQNFVENLIDFNGWAKRNKIKFLKENNPQLLEQLINENKI